MHARPSPYASPSPAIILDLLVCDRKGVMIWGTGQTIYNPSAETVKPQLGLTFTHGTGYLDVSILIHDPFSTSFSLLVN